MAVSEAMSVLAKFVEMQAVEMRASHRVPGPGHSQSLCRGLVSSHLAGMPPVSINKTFSLNTHHSNTEEGSVHRIGKIYQLKADLAPSSSPRILSVGFTNRGTSKYHLGLHDQTTAE